jgi:hypothetical protein
MVKDTVNKEINDLEGGVGEGVFLDIQDIHNIVFI